MSIFVIFLLLIFIVLMLKIKISVYFKFDNFERHIKIKTWFINFERKGKINSKKSKINKKLTKLIKKKILNKKKFLSNLKYLEIDKLNINILVDLILLMPTVFSVPIFSTILEYIKIIPFKKFNNYKYKITPLYNEKPKAFLEVDLDMKIRFFDLLKIIIYD